METMVCAYVFAWGAVTAYLTWIGLQNCQLCRRLKELERRASPGAGDKRILSRAA
jgi:hypothetical protein